MQWQRAVSTDAAGKYEIVGADIGKVLVQVTKEGHYQKGFPENAWMAMQQPNLAPQWKVDIGESGETTFDVAMLRGVRVEGSVEGPEGPLEGAKVTIGGASATSAAEGTFAVEGVAPGRPWATSSKEGYLDSKPEQITVSADAPTTGVVRRMVRQPVVRGRVSSAAGLPLLDAQVSVTVQQVQQGGMYPMEGGGGDWGSTPSAPVRPDGTYEAPVPGVAGKILVRAAALDHARGETSVDLVAGRDAYEADVVLEVGSALKGRVTAKNGSGVAGALVTIKKSSGGPQQDWRWQQQQQQAGTVVAVADSAGGFEIGHVGSGTWEVGASAEGFVRGTSKPVKVPGAGEVVVELEPALDISGKLVFADGAPAAGVLVQAQKDGQDQQGMYWGPGGVEQVTTDAAGAFRVRNLAPGSYRLQIQPSWGTTTNVKNKRSDAIAAGSTDVRVVVEAGGVISGRVVNVKKEGIGSVWIYGQKMQPDPNDTSGGWRYVMTKDDGSFELAGLADGAWTVTVNPQTGGLRGAVRPDVGVGTKDLEFVLDEGLSIEGVVQKGDGTPVAEVWLHPQPKRDPGDTSPQVPGGQGGSSDSEGKFTLTGLAPGRYSISIQQWNNPTQAWILHGGDDVAAGTTGVRLTVSEGEKIAGIVVDEAGSPIAGASLNVQVDNQWRHATTGTDGKFEISGFPATGAFRLTANAAGRMYQQLEQVKPGTRDLRIVLEKGMAVVGRLVDAAGGAAARSQLHFQKKGGGRGAACVTDTEGNFRCEGLQEGEYDVLCNRRKSDNNWESVNVGSCRAGDTGVELRIP